jgi:hypothetical protein
MVLIPVGLNYDVTLTGQAPKLVRCEACGYEYVYLLETSASGHGSSLLFLDNEGAQNRAHETAHVVLDAALQHGCAVVPCAQCGHVQAHMIPQARREYRRWMFKTGMYLLVSGAILAAPAILLTMIDNGSRSGHPVTVALAIAAVVLIGSGLILPYVRSRLAQKYDPNALTADFRKVWGDSLSVGKDEFIKMRQSSPCQQ